LERIVRGLSNLMYGVVALALAALALVFIGTSLVKIGAEVLDGHPTVPALLEAVGMTIVALAVFDVAKYLFEEEIIRERELRSAIEARQTLTKFLTIVIIAVGLEGILFVFQSGKEDVTQLLYPAGLLAVVGLLVTVLGHYQRTSRQAEAKGAAREERELAQ
jgi:hypothetical protein